jgi:glutamyl-tRNA reductase
MEINVSYIDHCHADKKILGQLYQNYDHIQNANSSKNYVFVNTCHRVEFYYFEKENITFEMQGIESKKIYNTIDAARRLTEVMSGVQSCIVGEKFIRDQTITHLTKHNNLFEFFSQCLEISDRARKKFNFYNSIDYTEIALSMLTEAEDLILIGGGMLVGEILSKNLNYKNIYVLTRNPKKFKKTHRLNKNVNVSKLENFKVLNNAVCVIATTMDDYYKSKIRNFIQHEKLLSVGDLSAIPALLQNENSKYFHMNDNAFLEKIEQGNAVLKEKIPLVKEFINSEIEKKFNNCLNKGQI